MLKMTDRFSAFEPPFRALVAGASGGIGAALVEAIAASGQAATCYRTSRRAFATRPPAPTCAIVDLVMDLQDEASMQRVATQVGAEGPLHLIILATGMLHDGDLQPEKTYRQLDADRLARAFAVNATGPALAAKHLLPLLARHQRAVFAALSARVGSISDNRMGGWYGYRAAKAALNMLVRCLAIEVARRSDQTIVVALHPGTVDTSLSAPFQGHVRPEKLFSPARAAHCLLSVIDGLTPADNGLFFAWDGARIDP